MAKIEAIIVMGVSGSGKTTIGRGLADALGWAFADADDFHPKANIDKMRTGIPLNDRDRTPWLAAIKAWIDQRLQTGQQGVVACSALKNEYRAMLTAGRPQVTIVYLKGEPGLIHDRLAHRDGHFMPPTLLDSQFDTLEEPKADDNTIIVSIEPTPARIVQNILDKLGRSSNQRSVP